MKLEWLARIPEKKLYADATKEAIKHILKGMNIQGRPAKKKKKNVMEQKLIGKRKKLLQSICYKQVEKKQKKKTTKTSNKIEWSRKRTMLVYMIVDLVIITFTIKIFKKDSIMCYQNDDHDDNDIPTEQFSINISVKENEHSRKAQKHIKAVNFSKILQSNLLMMMSPKYVFKTEKF